jgi:hypothetical protein
MPSPQEKHRPVTHLAGGLQLFKPLVRKLAKDPDRSAGPPLNHLLWLNSRDFRTLARNEGPAVVSLLGTVIGCGTAIYPAESDVRIPQIAGLVARLLISAKFDKGRFTFRPGALVEERLDAEAAKAREMLAQQPRCLRDLLLPEPHLAWLFSALLAAMCAGQQDEGSDFSAAVAGSTLATRVILSHVRHIRREYPADQKGFFDGRDLTVFRRLGKLPVTVRGIQRSLRGVRKEQILQSLHRAVHAGLAVETMAGHFATGPGPKVELSEFGAIRPPDAAPAPHFLPKSTDNTDNFQP